MSTRPQRYGLSAGLFVRNRVKAMLDLAGIPYIEHKGWTSSEIVVTCTPAQWHFLQAACRAQGLD